MDTQISAQKSQNQKWGFFGTMIWGVVVLVINGVSAALTLSIYAHVIYGDISIEFINKARSDSTALALCAFASLITGGLVLCGIIVTIQ